jgi:predicted helicase
LSDPYVKAIRWASDRIGNEGIVAFVTNNSFVNEITFDSMRKCLEQDFDSIHVLDLGGNVRKNPKLSGTTHNVFGIQIGVSINLFVKRKSDTTKIAKIYYASTDQFWRKEEKYDFLNQKVNLDNITWLELVPDARHNWLTAGMQNSFYSFIPIGSKEAKSLKELEPGTIFKTYSLGVNTARDSFTYNFNKTALETSVKRFADDYNDEVYRYQQKGKPKDIDAFVKYERIKWSRNLKRHFKNCDTFTFSENNIRSGLYRPFTKKWLYFSDIIVDEPGANHRIFPGSTAEAENRAICVPSLGGRTQFWSFCTGLIPNLTLTSVDANQCFPFYTYSEDGAHADENITDWALDQFQKHYADTTISKPDIFHYIYAVLHHPQYRDKFAANLKRELPRVPFAPDFWAFTKAGKELANLHVNYEAQPEYKLTWIEDIDARVNYRVERMTLSKDKTQIIYNDFVTLGGIPPEVFEYRLGNRSALDWIIDQYQVSTNKRSGITNDPNRLDDPQYIIRLIGKVITVSLETVKIVKSLPTFQ